MRRPRQVSLGIGWSIALCCIACGQSQRGATLANQAQLVSTLAQLETTLRQESSSALDTAKVNDFVQNAQALASRFPQDSLAPFYLFRAAELIHASGKFDKAIGLWGDIGNSFSKYNRSPEAAFMQGFVSENDLGDQEQAITYYQIFLNKYPEHTLAKDAQVLLDNLKKGVSDKELIKQFEQQQ